MSYDLHLDFATRTVLSDLQPQTRAAISYALINACDDPIAATQRHGEDDGVMRDLIVGDVIVVVYLNHTTKVMSVYQITALA